MTRRHEVRALDAVLHSVAHAILHRASRAEGLRRLGQYFSTLPSTDLRKMSGDHGHVAELARAYLVQHGPEWNLQLREEPKEKRDNLAELQDALGALS
jgi:hypothetical protein